MAYRDNFSRLCGPLFYREKDGTWIVKLAILDEEKCLLRFFDRYVYCPKNEKLWDCPDYREINTIFITKIEKKEADSSNEDSTYFEIQMFDTEKHFLKAESEEEIDNWIKNLHRVTVDPTRRQEGKMKKSIKDSLPRESKQNGASEAQQEQSSEPISYETKIIGGVVVRRPVSKKSDSDSDSLSGGSHIRSMSGGPSSSGYKIIKQGYLNKKGAVVRNWKRRYFKLDKIKLGYYEKETDREPIRAIATVDIMFVRRCASNEGNRDNLFEVITPSRTFIIQADNEEDMKSWVKEIQDATNSLQGRSSSGPEPATITTTVTDNTRCLSVSYYTTTAV